MTTLSRDDHDRLVASLYSSAAGETSWSATLAQFADRFHSSVSVLQIVDKNLASVSSEVHGYSQEDADAFYASGAFSRDPRLAQIYKVPAGSVYYDHMLYDVEEMARDSRVRETIDVLKVQYQLGAALRLPNVVGALFAVLSTPAEGHASPSAIRSFRRLAPHIEQACALGQLVEREVLTRMALLNALEHKADGVILLNGSGGSIFMNGAAAEILRADDGLHYESGTFITRRSAETRKLQRMIGDAIGASLGAGDKPGGQMLVTRLSGKRPFVLRVLPVASTERFLTGNSIAGVIYVQDLAKVSTPSKESLSRVFGFTQREADLGIGLLHCVDLEAAAASAEMACNTARNHLQSMFRKSGTASQAKLLQLLGRLI
jgi:PAS domain-containing protein